MAHLLPLSFFTPVCHRQPPFSGTHTRILTGQRFKTPVTSRKGIKHILHNYSGGGLSSSNGSYHWSPTRQSFETILCHFGVSVLISGFWMGPDIDDGWGFVEASVHQIY